MAHPFGVAWLTLREIVSLFVQMGCTVNDLDAEIEGPDGSHCVRYLYSPVTKDFASLSDFDDEDRIPWSVVEGWERRLGVEIPKGNLN